MIPNDAIDRSLISGGVSASTEFGVSLDDSAHIMSILREQIYSDRILAVLREYSANAWDAHRSVGKSDVPIKITVPTSDDYSLAIRDYGPGLSHDDVFKVYTQYGKSTKRNDDNSVGMLGIGSKSAFAYSDQFTITSWHGSVRRVYVAVLDESNKGRMQLMHEEPCAADETGVEVKVLVKPSDVEEFTSKAQRLFQHMEPRPDINIELPSPPLNRIELEHGYVDYVPARSNEYSYEAGTWYAVMGCVPYRIRLDQLDLCPEHRSLNKLSGVLPFNIGELQISASREELRYSKQTKDALLAKFTALVDDYILHALTMLEQQTVSAFQRRLKARQMHDIGFELPGEWESLVKGTVRLFDDPDKSLLYLIRDGAATNTITVNEHACLFIDDTGKKLKGYNLASSQYVVRINRTVASGGVGVPQKNARNKPLTEFELAQVERQLAKDLEACELTGIPVRKLSGEYWSDWKAGQGSRGSSERNRKHSARMFQYVGKRLSYKKASDNWDIVLRVPTKDDVFVVLEQFEPTFHDSFHSGYTADKAILEALNEEMPVIYGYKSTEKKPVDEGDCVGITYRKWREQFFAKLDTPDIRNLCERVFWFDVFEADHLSEHRINPIVASLGPLHEISYSLLHAKRATAGFTTDKRNAIRSLAARIGFSRGSSEAQRMLDALLQRYPLIGYHGGLKMLWGHEYGVSEDGALKRRSAWLEYIQLMDARQQAEVSDLNTQASA